MITRVIVSGISNKDRLLTVYLYVGRASKRHFTLPLQLFFVELEKGPYANSKTDGLCYQQPQ